MSRRHLLSSQWRPGAIGLALLCLVGLLAGCGDEPEAQTVDELLVVLDSGSEEEIDAAIDGLAVHAKADPQAVVSKLADALRNYEGERHLHLFEFRIDEPDATPQERRGHLEQVAMMLPRRLADWGYPAGWFAQDDERVVLRLARPSLAAEDMKRHVDNLVFKLAAPGTLQMRLVVSHPGDADEVESLWDGDVASFEAYLQSESLRLAEALRAGRAFKPTRSAYRTVMLRPGPMGGTPTAVMVFEPSKRSERFGTVDLKVRGALHRDTGQAVLEINVDKKRQKDMAAWSTKYHGHAVAVLLNGSAMQITRIGSVIRDRAVISVGPGDAPETLDWLKAFVTATRTGPYPAHVVGKLLDAKPEHLDLPVARALAAIGAPAEGPLREIAKEGGANAPVARWALGEITRLATGQARDQ